MTVRQRLQWVPVPAGPGLLSVFLAPRLESDEGDFLSLFEDFLDWPARLATATFRVVVDDRPPAPVQPAGPLPDSELWLRLFGPDTPIRSYEFDDYQSHEVVTYPARTMTAAARSGYAAVAASSPTELPGTDSLPFDDVGDAAGQFAAFHGRAQESAEMDSPESFRESVDFHQMLSALGDHPLLLRRLGLVFDLSVPDALVPADGQTIQVLVTYDSLHPSGFVDDLPARVRYVHAPGSRQGAGSEPVLVAAASGGEPLGSPALGVIALPQEQFSVEQADIDGAAQQAFTAAREANSGYPALRTSGFSLVRDGRAAFLQDDFALAADREAALARNEAIELTAEDLVRGHRLDVFDEAAGRWFSLHERTVDYTVPGAPALSAPGVRAEGFFQVSLTQPPGGGALYVHERIITWDGWSLSAARPGKVLSEDHRAPDPSEPATLPKRVANTARTTLPLEIETSALPGSLPRLRFGRAYRFRVRTVDLAGNGPSLDSAADLGPQFQAGPEVFRRYEPVPAPSVLPRSRFEDGASTQLLVIRSTPGQTAAEFAVEHPAFAGFDERHVAAPKAALQLVEWHGLLDAAIGSASPDVRREIYELARREKGALDDLSLPAVSEVVVRRPAGEVVQRYVVHTGASLEVPYLPDPLSIGAVFHGLPGSEAFEVPWDGPQWHRPRSFRLVLTDGEGPPSFDPALRVLTVRLPRGTVATVRLSSRVTAGGEILGLLDWCREELDPAGFAEVLVAARENRHWMITPWQELTLVHATQRPLTAPALEFFPGIDRSPGDTHAHLFGSVRLHIPTTERIDLIAQWPESIDDLAFDGPRVRDCSAHVFRLPVALARDFVGDSIPEEVPSKQFAPDGLTFNTRPGPVPARQEFGDTRHRSISYHAVAGSAFREFFPPSFASDDQLSVAGEPVVVEVPSTARPSAPQVLYCVPTQRWELSPGVRHRHGGGVRIYLDRPWFSSGDGELLGVLMSPFGAVSPGEPLSPYISMIGRDPIYDAAAVPSLTPSSFPLAVSAGSFPLPALPGFDVSVAGHQVSYDASTRRWFCDIDLSTGDSYFPFVRLALARFQPHSIPSMHLSEVVLTDLIRVLPTRTLQVLPGSPSQVIVSGPSYREPEGSRLTAHLDRRDPAISDPTLGWQPVAGTLTTLRPTFTEDGQIMSFSGAVAVPANVSGRLVVQEFERLPSDVDGATHERLVYCDTVSL
jgi:hypothetical protein